MSLQPLAWHGKEASVERSGATLRRQPDGIAVGTVSYMIKSGPAELRSAVELAGPSLDLPPTSSTTTAQ